MTKNISKLWIVDGTLWKRKHLSEKNTDLYISIRNVILKMIFLKFLNFVQGQQSWLES